MFLSQEKNIWKKSKSLHPKRISTLDLAWVHGQRKEENDVS